MKEGMYSLRSFDATSAGFRDIVTVGDSGKERKVSKFSKPRIQFPQFQTERILSKMKFRSVA